MLKSAASKCIFFGFYRFLGHLVGRFRIFDRFLKVQITYVTDITWPSGQVKKKCSKIGRKKWPSIFWSSQYDKDRKFHDLAIICNSHYKTKSCHKHVFLNQGGVPEISGNFRDFRNFRNFRDYN